MSLGDFAVFTAFQADRTSYVAVLRATSCGINAFPRTKHAMNVRALMRDTASVILFFVYCLKASFILGNGRSHLNAKPKSPIVPMHASQSHVLDIDRCRGWQRMYDSNAEVATGSL